MSEIELRIDGFTYEGWQTIEVVRDIEALASSFALGFTEQWGGRAEPLPIEEGALCELWYKTTQLISGYVDDSLISYDDQSHTMNVSGRSALGDLVDCAAVKAGGQWKNASFARIASDLLAPFGIDQQIDASVSPRFKNIAIQEGESVKELLSRLAVARGVLLTSTGSGKLWVTKAGTNRTNTRIVRGVNILRGRRKGSMLERFSSYKVTSQTSGDDNIAGSNAAHIKAIATDDRVGRYRPIVLVAEGQLNGAEVRKRAQWERNTRAGRSQTLTYVLDGWENAEGVWGFNTIAHVVDDFFRVDDDLLITSVKLTQGAEGKTTELTLTQPAAFDVLKVPIKVKKKDAFFDQFVSKEAISKLGRGISKLAEGVLK